MSLGTRPFRAPVLPPPAQSPRHHTSACRDVRSAASRARPGHTDAHSHQTCGSRDQRCSGPTPHRPPVSRVRRPYRRLLRMFTHTNHNEGQQQLLLLYTRRTGKRNHTRTRKSLETQSAQPPTRCHDRAQRCGQRDAAVSLLLCERERRIPGRDPAHCAQDKRSVRGSRNHASRPTPPRIRVYRGFA